MLLDILTLGISIVSLYKLVLFIDIFSLLQIKSRKFPSNSKIKDLLWMKWTRTPVGIKKIVK